VELSSEDYRDNRDPALAAALGYVPRKSLAQLLDEALTEGGSELALKRFREFKADAVNKYAATEEPLLVAGQRLLNEKKYAQALALFKVVAEERPHSFRGYHAMGYAYFALGDKAQAVKNLERALELNPKNYDVAELLRQAKQR
jgi:tetratricopeptide (TPR) repeat protein